MRFGERFKGLFGGREKAGEEPELKEAAEKAEEQGTWDVTRQPEMEKEVGEASISDAKFNELVDMAVAKAPLSDEQKEKVAAGIKADAEMKARFIKMAAQQSEGGERATEEVLEELIGDHIEKGQKMAA